MKINEIVNEGWSEKYKRSINCKRPKGFSQRAHCQGKKKNESVTESLDENLRDWFGKGKSGGAGGGGWDRYNTKGERIGKCGDRKPGEGKPKCLSKSKAASLRASGGKKAIANAVKRKRSQDKNPERKGKAKHVSNVTESHQDYDIAKIWASNFVAHGKDMRFMFDIEDGSQIVFDDIPEVIQREIERQVGGDIGAGELVTIKQHPSRDLENDHVTVLVPPPQEVDEGSMEQAEKNPIGSKFGGYYRATQKGSPKAGQGFGSS